MYIGLCQLLLQANDPFALVEPNDCGSRSPHPNLSRPRRPETGFLLLGGPPISRSARSSHCLILSLCPHYKTPQTLCGRKGSSDCKPPNVLQRPSSGSHPHPQGRAHQLRLPAGLALKGREFGGLWLSSRKNTPHPHPLKGARHVFPSERVFLARLSRPGSEDEGVPT